MSPSSSRMRDAAVVLQSLPDETLSDVLSRLDSDCKQQLSTSMASVGEVSGEEFHQISKRFRSHAFGGHHAAEMQSPYDALLWPRDRLASDDEPFGFLKYLESEPRRNLLETEHPGNVAMVLSTMAPQFASVITRELDPKFRLSVIRRLCDLDVVDEARMMELRFELRMRAKRMLAIANCTRRGLAVAAELLSLADQRTRDGVVAWLNDRDEAMADALQQEIFTMQDLLEFSDEEIKLLLKKVDTSAWAGALRSAVPSVGQRVLACMAPRAANIVSAEMTAFNPLDEKAMQWSLEQVIGAAIRLRK